jgi:hypothetical protein
MAVPNAPTLMSVVPTAVGTLTITWIKDVTGSEVTGFKIYTGTVLVHALVGSLVQTYDDISLGNGTAKDVKSLINLAKIRVKTKFDVALREEIQFL